MIVISVFRNLLVSASHLTHVRNDQYSNVLRRQSRSDKRLGGVRLCALGVAHQIAGAYFLKNIL